MQDEFDVNTCETLGSIDRHKGVSRINRWSGLTQKVGKQVRSGSKR